jgi:cobalt/nickel transport system permease protein
MQVDFLDRYAALSSALHRIAPRRKILACLVLVIFVVLTRLPQWPLFVAEAAVALGCYRAARLPWFYLAQRLAAALPLLGLLALSLPLSRGFAGGWQAAAELIIRASIALAMLVTLVATTPFSQLLRALRQLRVPAVLVAVLAFMYRYSFVLSDELERMRRARRARTFCPSVWSELAALGSFAGVLFVRAFERSERVYAAMCARGWRGDVTRLDDMP